MLRSTRFRTDRSRNGLDHVNTTAFVCLPADDSQFVWLSKEFPNNVNPVGFAPLSIEDSFRERVGQRATVIPSIEHLYRFMLVLK
jgi:hypothetical protein